MWVCVCKANNCFKTVDRRRWPSAIGVVCEVSINKCANPKAPWSDNNYVHSGDILICIANRKQLPNCRKGQQHIGNVQEIVCEISTNQLFYFCFPTSNCYCNAIWNRGDCSKLLQAQSLHYCCKWITHKYNSHLSTFMLNWSSGTLKSSMQPKTNWFKAKKKKITRGKEK